MTLSENETESRAWVMCLADYARKYPQAVARFDEPDVEAAVTVGASFLSARDKAPEGSPPQNALPCSRKARPAVCSLIVLERGDWRVEIDAQQWAEMLDFLEAHGWSPSVPANRFLQHGHAVSVADARKLNTAGQALLDEALAHPLFVYPIPFDMGKLAEVVTFCEEGAFCVRRQTSAGSDIACESSS